MKGLQRSLSLGALAILLAMLVSSCGLLPVNIAGSSRLSEDDLNKVKEANQGVVFLSCQETQRYMMSAGDKKTNYFTAFLLDSDEHHPSLYCNKPMLVAAGSYKILMAQPTWSYITSISGTVQDHERYDMPEEISFEVKPFKTTYLGVVTIDVIASRFFMRGLKFELKELSYSTDNAQSRQQGEKFPALADFPELESAASAEESLAAE